MLAAETVHYLALYRPGQLAFQAGKRGVVVTQGQVVDVGADFLQQQLELGALLLEPRQFLTAVFQQGIELFQRLLALLPAGFQPGLLLLQLLLLAP